MNNGYMKHLLVTQKNLTYIHRKHNTNILYRQPWVL
jgi:hypothetical protein